MFHFWFLSIQTVEEEEETTTKTDQAASSLEIPPWMRALGVQAAQWIAALPESITAVKRTAERIKDPLFRFFEREIVSGQKLLAKVYYMFGCFTPYTHSIQVRGDLRDVIACCEGQIKQTNDLRAILQSLNRGIVFKVGLVLRCGFRSHPCSRG
jgi:dynein heavy chain 1